MFSIASHTPVTFIAFSPPNSTTDEYYDLSQFYGGGRLSVERLGNELTVKQPGNGGAGLESRCSDFIVHS